MLSGLSVEFISSEMLVSKRTVLLPASCFDNYNKLLCFFVVYSPSTEIGLSFTIFPLML